MGEFRLIHDYLKPLATHPYSQGLADDVAQLTDTLIVTTDTMVVGKHCFGFEPPSYMARKLMRVNLSDVAAKGGMPFAYTLNLALPMRDPEEWLADFCQGLRLEQAHYGLHLLGGDTVATVTDTVLTLTLYAHAPVSYPKRGVARVGDDVYVSGQLGKAYTGYTLLKQAGKFIASPATMGYLLPEPRLSLGQAIAPHIHASMDISDGLLGDIQHILKASNIGVTLHSALIPIVAGQGSDALNFGDDYELLFTASPDKATIIHTIARDHGILLTKIGYTTSTRDLVVLGEDGQPLNLPQKGHEHFV
jgi:thiamine-monophosphate kinase